MTGIAPRRRRPLSVPLARLAIVTAGCGSDEDDSGAATDENVAAPADEVTDEPPVETSTADASAADVQDSGEGIEPPDPEVARAGLLALGELLLERVG